MSISELTASRRLRLPRFSAEVLARRAELTMTRLQKRAERKARRLTRLAIACMRSQYYLTGAYRDLRIAAMRNEDIVIAGAIITVVLGFSFAAAVANLLLLFFESILFVSQATGFSMLPLTVCTLAICAQSAFWLLTFLANVLSISLMDGANRKEIKSLRSTLRRSLAATSRVANAWLLLLALIAAWVIASSGLSLAVVQLAGLATSKADLLIKSVFIVPFGVLYLLGTYGLAPQVSLFEQNVPLMSTLARSKQLMPHHGRLFILALYAAGVSFIGVLYLLCALIANTLQLDLSLVVYSFGVITLLAINCFLAMLYRKRKLAKRP